MELKECLVLNKSLSSQESSHSSKAWEAYSYRFCKDFESIKTHLVNSHKRKSCIFYELLIHNLITWPFQQDTLLFHSILSNRRTLSLEYIPLKHFLHMTYIKDSAFHPGTHQSIFSLSFLRDSRNRPNIYSGSWPFVKRFGPINFILKLLKQEPWWIQHLLWNTFKCISVQISLYRKNKKNQKTHTQTQMWSVHVFLLCVSHARHQASFPFKTDNRNRKELRKLCYFYCLLNAQVTNMNQRNYKNSHSSYVHTRNCCLLSIANPTQYVTGIIDH